MECCQTEFFENKLKPPMFILEGKKRVQQHKNLTTRFGRMLMRRETEEIRGFSREGKLLTKRENKRPGITMMPYAKIVGEEGRIIIFHGHKFGLMKE